MPDRIKAHFKGNVVGYVALFVALGGTSAWATQQITSKEIARNAVRSRQIKNGQVRSADVRDNGLTGKDINEASLGQVPNAASAVQANTAQSAAMADSATTAQTADNADTLDSKDSTAFGAGIEGGRMVGIGSAATGTFPPIGISSGTGSILSPASFVARDLRIALTSLNAAGQTRTFALIVGGAPSALTCTVRASGGSCADTTHTVNLSPTNTYGIAQTATTGTPGATDVQFGWRAVTP